MNTSPQQSPHQSKEIQHKTNLQAAVLHDFSKIILDFEKLMVVVWIETVYALTSIRINTVMTFVILPLYLWLVH